MSRRKDVKKRWEPEFSTKGMMDFTVEGYVQDIKEGDQVDYVTFYIDNQYVSDNINCISVEVAWDDFPQLEKGDHVMITGCIRSWWVADIKKVCYSFVASDVEKVEKESGRRSRRTVAPEVG